MVPPGLLDASALVVDRGGSAYLLVASPPVDHRQLIEFATAWARTLP